MVDLPKDVLDFKRLCQAGNLYETLMADWDCDRERAKKRLFTHVPYCRRFPHVVEVIDRLKRHDYHHAGQMLQRGESSIVIHRACGLLMELDPEIPVFTIHDSIATTPENVPVVEAALAQAFGAVGQTPALKVEGPEDSVSEW